MFTGIVEETGRVGAIRVTMDGARLTVEASRVLGGTKKGDSIAVDGTCLTVTSMTVRSFDVDMAPETLSKTTLGDLSVGDGVNLERSLTPDARLGGHFVQGHVDSTGTIRGFRRDGDSLRVVIGLSPDLMRYLAPKGYVAIDGVSLTVVDVLEDGFSIMLVPYTMQHITRKVRRTAGERGSRHSLEVGGTCDRGWAQRHPDEDVEPGENRIGGRSLSGRHHTIISGGARL